MLQQSFNYAKSCTSQSFLASHIPKLLPHAGTPTAFSISRKKLFSTGKSKRTFRVLRHASTRVKAIITSPVKSTRVKVAITVLETIGGAFSNIGLASGLDGITDMFGKSLLVELVAAELDPKSGLQKAPVKAYAHRKEQEKNATHYETDNFTIPEDFGEVGAILVENEHRREMFLHKIVINETNGDSTEVSCNSWLHSKFDNPEKRLFFSNKSYLPSQTPSGLTKYRERELEIVRGNGQGERKTSDRIYDYDTYNDLGDPDNNEDLVRPILGGAKHPYPRRCRTGRPRTKKDPLSETRSSDVYVPRDEKFSEVKQTTFSVKTVSSVLKGLIPALKASVIDSTQGFPYFTAIDSLYNEGINLPDISTTGFLQNIIPRLVRTVSSTRDKVLRFETPELMDRDKFAWFRDSEFARQTLAGLNPCCIKLVTEWPLKSTLDPEEYGPPESAFTKEMVECESKSNMKFEQALKQKRLFVLDHHDVLIPYVKKVREIKGTTLYGSRTLFFLTDYGTLRPLAIELTRPPLDGKPQWKHVFVEPCDATGVWLWRLAKCHVLAHDSGYHQLVSHWLRTHCCTEPYIIATNRQLSKMHPIHRLLCPHLRYTMEINALAREALINAGGIIETGFSPGKYAIEISSVAYDLLWQFNLEALPADLINRGMAVEDPKSPHGLKLTIADYPYANDGLLVWDAIKEWLSDYVNHYYPEASAVQSDDELQAWWTEIRTVGHEDKKDEPWWPELKTCDDLIGILTTIIWVASGHHAAVNFGQYHFAGYFPNRPTIARTPMPNEDPNEEAKARFLERPEEFLLKCFPSQVQATTVMAILDVLSTHSIDEEYLGDEIEPSFAENKVIKAAFERFSGRLKEIEGIIDARNADPNFYNRTGAGVIPYELLRPASEAGVTAKGIPNSISI